MNAGEPFGPGAAQEFGEHGFGLIVEGVRGGNSFHLARSHQFTEPAITQAASRFFNRLSGFVIGRVEVPRFGAGLGFGGNIDAGFVKGQAQFFGQSAGEGQIGVGLGAAKSMVEVGSVEHQAQFPAALRKGTGQGNGVRAAGKTHGQAKPRLEQSGIDRKKGAHQSDDTAFRPRSPNPEPTHNRAKPPPLYTPPVMQVFAIFPAAGLGTRMAGPQPKQFLALNGIPILIHSLRAFAAVERVTAIYVAVRKSEVERVEAQIAEYGFADRVRVVEGGENRQESVAHALAALPAGPDDIVLVHDAVRPLIDAATIDRTIDAVVQHGAAIVGLPAVDTIKQVERTAHGALITSTIPREFVVLAQTPQGFRYGLLRNAFAEATADGFVGTDEASLVERAGQPVAVVPGSQVNLKITQPGDLELAEFYLRQRAR